MSTAPTRDRIYRSAFMAIALQWSVRAIGLVSVVVLARLLDPSDFGLMAIAATAVIFVELFGWIGLRQALLRIKEPERAHYDTAWTIQLLVFAGLSVVLFAIVAPVTAHFYEQPALGDVLRVLSLRFLLTGLVNIGVVDFERNFEFGRDLRMRIGSRVAALVVTIAAALLFKNYWALVIGLVTQSAFFALSSYLAHPFRPRFSLTKTSELLGFSLWLLVYSLAYVVQDQIDRLVLGRFGATYVLGLYSVSKDLAQIFTEEVSIALNRVTFVSLANDGETIEGNPARILTLVGAYAMIAAPMGLGLAATAPDAVRVLLGDKWIGAIALLQIVAISSAFRAVHKVVTSTLQATGRPKRAAGIATIDAAIMTAGVIIAAYAWRSAEAVAFAVLVVNLAMLATGAGTLAFMGKLRALSVAGSLARPFLAAGGMYMVVTSLPVASGWPIVNLAISVIVGAVTYASLLMLIWLVFGRPQGAEREAINFIEAKRGKGLVGV